MDRSNGRGQTPILMKGMQCKLPRLKVPTPGTRAVSAGKHLVTGSPILPSQAQAERAACGLTTCNMEINGRGLINASQAAGIQWP